MFAPWKNLTLEASACKLFLKLERHSNRQNDNCNLLIFDARRRCLESRIASRLHLARSACHDKPPKEFNNAFIVKYGA